MRNTDRCNALSLAVLSLLAEVPMHPYEIAFQMKQRGLVDTIRLRLGSLYHCVEGLQAGGLIAPERTDREGRRPERTVYAITDQGQRVFLEALSELIRTPEREYSNFEAGLCFLLNLSAEEAAGLLEERAAALAEQVAGRRAKYDAVRAKGLSRIALIEHEHAIAAEVAELEWVRRFANDVRSGGVAWQPFVPAAIKEGEGA